VGIAMLTKARVLQVEFSGNNWEARPTIGSSGLDIGAFMAGKRIGNQPKTPSNGFGKIPGKATGGADGTVPSTPSMSSPFAGKSDFIKCDKNIDTTLLKQKMDGTDEIVKKIQCLVNNEMYRHPDFNKLVEEHENLFGEIDRLTPPMTQSETPKDWGEGAMELANVLQKIETMQSSSPKGNAKDLPSLIVRAAQLKRWLNFRR
jgi:hypothetical protein